LLSTLVLRATPPQLSLLPLMPQTLLSMLGLGLGLGLLSER
jgi:hypothetical protein